jgi:hypothetical protein
MFNEVTEWEDSFLHLDFRWSLLALVGDSQSGKSMFAEHLFSNPWVITVESAQHLDLKGFDAEKHDGIVLDNVNTWAQLLEWRAILQGRNAKSQGAQTASNMYAYAQYLYGVAVVASVDLDAPDAHLVDPDSAESSNWLVKNCKMCRVSRDEKFYDKDRVPKVKVPNIFSLFTQTVKRRRGGETATNSGQPARQSSDGLPTKWTEEEEELAALAGVGSSAEAAAEEEEEDPFGWGTRLD